MENEDQALRLNQRETSEESERSGLGENEKASLPKKPGFKAPGKKRTKSGCLSQSTHR